MTTLTNQNKTLKKYFRLTIEIPKQLPSHPEAEGVFLVPNWTKIGKTYPEALKKVLDALKKDRPFYNWKEGQIDENHIRRHHSGNTVLPEIIPAQLGKKYKGVSVENVRKQITQKEVLLGAYEVGIILLTNPDILRSYDDLWIDCAGDEWSYGADGAFSGSPCFDFGGGGLGFGAGDVDGALDGFGSGSAFPPQSLETRNLDSVEDLKLESAIKMVKEAGYQVSKIM